MIYRYLVVSRSDKPIELSRTRLWMSGGIEINILLANRQIFDESVKILYDENKFLVGFNSMSSTYQDIYHKEVSNSPIGGVINGVFFFRIDEATKASGTRSLRSGRTIDMIKYHGLIYEKIFCQLRHVELRVSRLLRIVCILKGWITLSHYIMLHQIMSLCNPAREILTVPCWLHLDWHLWSHTQLWPSYTVLPEKSPNFSLPRPVAVDNLAQ